MIQDSQYAQVCSYENLESAYENARERKSGKRYVLEFEKNHHNNLLQLREELLSHTYKPLPLKTFILRDPKTRKISRSEFRDRIVHIRILAESTLELNFNAPTGRICSTWLLLLMVVCNYSGS